MKSLLRTAAVAALAAPLLLGISTAANASTISQCTDKYQVGSTSYIPDEYGGTAASVKQFWSPMCAQNFAYVYVWQSFRDTHTSWSVDVVEVYVDSAGNETVEGEQYSANTRGSDFWSHGYSGGGKCTYAYGTLFYGSHFGEAKTDTRCG
jgi:hypothetical protein